MKLTKQQRAEVVELLRCADIAYPVNTHFKELTMTSEPKYENPAVAYNTGYADGQREERDRLSVFFKEVSELARKLALRAPDDDSCVQCGQWLGSEGHNCPSLLERLVQLRKKALGY